MQSHKWIDFGNFFIYKCQIAIKKGFKYLKITHEFLFKCVYDYDYVWGYKKIPDKGDTESLYLCGE